LVRDIPAGDGKIEKLFRDVAKEGSMRVLIEQLKEKLLIFIPSPAPDYSCRG
jgi:hypothetical protein